MRSIGGRRWVGLAGAAIVACSASMADAAITITATETLGATPGQNQVVFSASGSLTVTGALAGASISVSNTFSSIRPNPGGISFLGVQPSTNIDSYKVTGTSFGTSNTISYGDSVTGSLFYVGGTLGEVFLPDNYQSGTSIAATVSFLGKTFADLGIDTSQDAVWKLTNSSGAEVDRITLTFSQVPLPAALPLLATALGGLWLQRRRQRFSPNV